MFVDDGRAKLGWICSYHSKIMQTSSSRKRMNGVKKRGSYSRSFNCSAYVATALELAVASIVTGADRTVVGAIAWRNLAPTCSVEFM